MRSDRIAVYQYDDELENVAKFGDKDLALQSIERSKNARRDAPLSSKRSHRRIG